MCVYIYILLNIKPLLCLSPRKVCIKCSYSNSPIVYGCGVAAFCIHLESDLPNRQMNFGRDKIPRLFFSDPEDAHCGEKQHMDHEFKTKILPGNSTVSVEKHTIKSICSVVRYNPCILNLDHQNPQLPLIKWTGLKPTCLLGQHAVFASSIHFICPG